MRWKFHLFSVTIYLLFILHGSFTNVESSTSTEDSEEDSVLVAMKKDYSQYQNEKKQLEINKKKFEDNKKIDASIAMTDVIRFNVGGEIIISTRKSLTSVSTSTLAKLFSGRWEKKISHDTDTNIFLDFNPTLFRHLLEQLRHVIRNSSSRFTPPHSSSPFVIRSFNRMLKILGLDSSQSSPNEMVVMNVGGDRILTRQKTLNSSQPTVLISHPFQKSTTGDTKRSGHFIDTDPWLFRHLLGQLRENKSRGQIYFHAPSSETLTSMNRMLKNFGLNPLTTTMSTATTTSTTTTTTSTIKNVKSIPPYPAQWQTEGVTVAGGHAWGNMADQLNGPCGLFVDDDQTVYIADYGNHRIIGWKAGATTGEVLAGGNGEGDRLNQLNRPTGVIVDRETDSLLICDQWNRRLIRWPRRPSSHRQPEIVIDNIKCRALTLDDQGSLYVSDEEKHEVRRYDKNGNKKGTVVAGGHGRGGTLNRLNAPSDLFVDAQSTLYVSDHNNHRVMKWMKGAKEGIVVAGGNRWDGDMIQWSYPRGVWVDGDGHVYVVEEGNHRVTRWEKGAKQGTLIVGGNGKGQQTNQLSGPEGLFFDRHGHLYVADYGNARVQRFSLC